MKVKSTSQNSAEVEDIVLRSTNTTRLLFRPLLVNNAQDVEASIKGQFVFQRKTRAQTWKDYKELDLTQLRAEQWIKLELKSGEVLTLFRELSALYKLYDEVGIRPGEFNYVRAASDIAHLLEASEEQLEEVLQEHPDDAHMILERMLSWFLSKPKHDRDVELLEGLDPQQVSQLSELAGLKRLRDVLQVWEENQNNGSEEFWQRCFQDNSFVLSQIFAHPIVIVQGKMYVGEKKYNNQGGKHVDFLLRNEITHNAVLVEIKTPTSHLLNSGEYRGGIYAVSSEMSGALVQALTYRQSLIENWRTVIDFDDEEHYVENFEPIAVIVAGNSAVELSNNRKKRRSFELFRSQLRHVQLITYDELFAKVKTLISLLEGEKSEEHLLPPEPDWDQDKGVGDFREEDDIPF